MFLRNYFSLAIAWMGTAALKIEISQLLSNVRLKEIETF